CCGGGGRADARVCRDTKTLRAQVADLLRREARRNAVDDREIALDCSLRAADGGGGLAGRSPHHDHLLDRLPKPAPGHERKREEHKTDKPKMFHASLLVM